MHMNEKIDVTEHASEIIAELKRGVLLTVKAGEKVNPMTIGWGMIGVEWRKPVFIAYVRTDRYTHELMEDVDCFTVNIPVPADDAETEKRVRKILATCGTKSGRDIDKVAELGLTLRDGEQVGAPAILELPLTLECRIIYRRDQDVDLMPEDLRESVYGPREGGLLHTAYYGEIVDAYITR